MQPLIGAFLFIMSKTFKKTFRKKLIEYYGYKCQICGDESRPKFEYEIDHIIPKSKGGESTKGNAIILCKTCNCRKHTFYKESLLEKIYKLTEDLEFYKKIYKLQEGKDYGRS